MARRSGVSARMLRHYDALGLVRPSGRSGSGYREYSEPDLRRIFHVESLRSLGLSLKEIGRALDDPEFAPSTLVADLIERTEERIRLETELLRRLGHVARTGPEEWEEVLAAVALLTELGSRSPGARQHAALAAGDGSAPVGALTEALLQEESPNVAGALRWALTQSGAAEARDLAAGLDDEDSAVRRRAAEALAELPDRSGALRSALAHPDRDVRSIIAVELGLRGDAAATTELVTMVVDGVRDVPAAEALGAIAALADAEETIVDALTAAFDAAVDYAVRQRVVQAVAEIPGAAADSALSRLAGDQDTRIAHTAAFIRRLRSPR
ncbi:HEAT repeat domain-containing protein [Tsukamurella sp. 1534]|uniref:HEAT repeat domain-containing protein n=1 Tax=Tsukamurella sp. 1534 TaxID=1151061 RepID=UPI001ED9ABC1|nr:HEAT repeat domain-containing protein [Tsukamurella sp. 1534]